jgi:hypothetical protein
MTGQEQFRFFSVFRLFRIWMWTRLCKKKFVSVCDTSQVARTDWSLRIAAKTFHNYTTTSWQSHINLRMNWRLQIILNSDFHDVYNPVTIQLSIESFEQWEEKHSLIVPSAPRSTSIEIIKTKSLSSRFSQILMITSSLVNKSVCIETREMRKRRLADPNSFESKLPFLHENSTNVQNRGSNLF